MGAVATTSEAGIESAIVVLRGQRVLLDADLAALYAVQTRVLVQAVKRNAERFPADFMFQLTADEVNALRSQSVISNRGGRRYEPYAFTEQGVAMLSSVLRSPRAVAVNIEIMRAFVRLRAMAAAHDELSRRLDELEGRYDERFANVFAAMSELMAPGPAAARRLGFATSREALAAAVAE
ncbi:MAG: ORF6N domain-containing protein [Tepidiformaceae bacterium]